MLDLERLVIGYPGFSLSADLRIDTPSRVALLGPSGAGKSSLLSAIAGFLPPVSGTIRLDGRDITRALPSERGVAIIFQDQNLFPHMTAAQNVGLALSPRLNLSGSDVVRVRSALTLSANPRKNCATPPKKVRSPTSPPPNAGT